jgi:hypothetical protein
MYSTVTEGYIMHKTLENTLHWLTIATTVLLALLAWPLTLLFIVWLLTAAGNRVYQQAHKETPWDISEE